jgi:AcrR family transcriptional regulator
MSQPGPCEGGGAPQERAPLNRQRVLEAALGIIDGEGVDALSMRRLGAALGVDPMAVYRHVDGKGAVLDGVAELLWAELPDHEPEDGDWDAGLRAFARSIRAVFHAHPQAAPLLLQRPILPVPQLEKSYQQLERLQAAGFGRDAAAEVLRTIMAFSTGYGLAEVTCYALEDAEEWPPVESERDLLVAIAQFLPPGTPPRLVDLAASLWAATDAEATFESSIDLILAGACLRLEEQAASSG